MTPSSKAYMRIRCLLDSWSNRTARSLRRAEHANGCTGWVRRGSGAALRNGGLRRMLRIWKACGRSAPPRAALNAKGQSRLRGSPGHLEFAAAPLAQQAARSAADGLASVAARAHGVAVTPVRRDAHRVARPGHDAPLARRAVDHLQERRWDLERTAPAHLYHRLQRIETRDAIPRTPSQSQVQVGPQSGPLPRHCSTPGERALPACSPP